MHNITFNGVASDSLGVRIERAPRIIRPRRKADVIQIPGRNGDLVLMQDAWENYVQPYEIFFGTGADLSAETAADAVSAWLHSANGYARLEDSYEPDIYRLAYYVEEQDIENAITEYGRETIRFNCRPERFLKSGETEITLTRQTPGQDYFGYFTNPTKFHSKPIVKLTGSGSGYVQIYTAGSAEDYVNISIRINGLDGTIIIDCDSQEAYYGDTNLNNLITLTNGKFFETAASYNNVQVSSALNTNEIKIIPRWFRI